jgi:hypothetical protein
MLKRIFTFSNFTLLVALSLSAIAAWYSISGLTAIFAGAVIPIIIMGSILELSKIVTTVWLKIYWERVSFLLKLYLIPAVLALALMTSMGIFGFLSKAHSDQNLVSGDVIAKIAVYDEKIKTEKENIEANRKALKQMDEGVDQVLGRSTSEQGAEKAVAMRKSQQKERTRLQNEILQSQKSIAELNDARAPIAAEIRKVEAEVGPIKYIAAFLYGDNPDGNLLERAVRWVIILIVLVFDPLALMMVIAANQSRIWDREEKEKTVLDAPDYMKMFEDRVKDNVENPIKPAYEPDDGPINDEVLAQLRERAEQDMPQQETVSVSELFTQDEKDLGECYKCGTPLYDAPGIGPFCPNKECDVFDNTNGVEWEFTAPETKKPSFSNSNYTFSEPVITYGKNQPTIEIRKEPTVNDEITVDSTQPIITEGVTSEKPYQQLDGGYVVFDGKHMHMDVLKNMRPDVLKLVADNERQSNTSFGTEFPKLANKGDTFVRVDVLPNRVYKFDGTRWIIVNKDMSTSYLHDQEYIKYLIQKIDNGEYDVELLSESEKQQIEEYLTKKDDKN